jgi:hypothetical protein
MAPEAIRPKRGEEGRAVGSTVLDLGFASGAFTQRLIPMLSCVSN